MKYFKLFENFVNESKTGVKLVDFLETMASKGWEKFGIDSGTDLYSDVKKQEKYVDWVKSEIKSAGNAADILKYRDEVHDELENDNYHHLNMLLSLAGYYGPDYKTRYMRYLKSRPTEAFALDLFEAQNTGLTVADFDEYVNPDYVEVTLSDGRKLEIKKKNVKGGQKMYQTILQALDSYKSNAKAKTFMDSVVNAMANNLD
jgi:hypothetical protein